MRKTNAQLEKELTILTNERNKLQNENNRLSQKKEKVKNLSAEEESKDHINYSTHNVGAALPVVSLYQVLEECHSIASRLAENTERVGARAQAISSTPEKNSIGKEGGVKETGLLACVLELRERLHHINNRLNCHVSDLESLMG